MSTSDAMGWLLRAFVRSSMAWLSLGVTLGVAMAVHPAWSVYRVIHLHMLLLGFVAMMIFGVAYHIMPRIAGRALHSSRAPTAHWWLSNAGLVLMAAGFWLRIAGVPHAWAILAVGGTASAAGAYVFAYVIWRTVGREQRPNIEDVARTARPGRRELRVLG